MFSTVNSSLLSPLFFHSPVFGKIKSEETNQKPLFTFTHQT
jgi:hypothetical protein